MKTCTPKITRFRWTLVDPPWNFYSIGYVLEDYVEHVVYIPVGTIQEELKTKSIVDIVVERLRAELACEPEHLLRVGEKEKDESKRGAIAATRRVKRS